MVLLTSEIYKAILQTFNSQPPLWYVLIPLPQLSSKTPRAVSTARGSTLLPFQFLSESVISSVYDFGKNSNGNA